MGFSGAKNWLFYGKKGYTDNISLWYECSSLSKAIKLAKVLHLIL